MSSRRKKLAAVGLAAMAVLILAGVDAVAARGRRWCKGSSLQPTTASTLAVAA